MSFDEVRLPVEVERGAAGGPGFLTNINLLNSGKETRNSLWEVDRGRWDIGYGIQEREDALAVRNFFMARRGRARGFRFKDWANYTTLNRATGVHTQQPTSELADQSETRFALYYRYIDSGAFFYEKRIWKPVAGTVAMFVDGAEIPSTDFTVDTTTGVVEFDTAPDYGANVTWTGEFDLPVRFDTDELNAVITTVNVISFPSLPIVEIKL